MLQQGLSRQALGIRGESNVECFCKEQYKPIIISYIGTEIAKVLKCIPRSHYDHIDTAGFLFMMTAAGLV